jgi:hypothetical protein
VGLGEAVAEYEVEPLGEAAGKCDCCAAPTRSVWGVVHLAGAETVASYFVTWIPEAEGVLAPHPANVDMILGAWGEGTGAADRVGVSLLRTQGAAGPAVKVIDAAPRKFARNTLVGAALGADEVIGTPLAESVFGIFEAVFAQDRRLGR